MTIIFVIIGCLLGVGLGFLLPTIPYTASNYLAIAIIAALDTVFGGIASNIKKNFDIGVFVSGFFVNAILAMFLTFVGQKLNVDIYLAAIIVFVGRMFNNLGIIRRYYLNKFYEKRKKNKSTNSK
jgi:small basic protein